MTIFSRCTKTQKPCLRYSRRANEFYQSTFLFDLSVRLRFVLLILFRMLNYNITVKGGTQSQQVDGSAITIGGQSFSISDSDTLFGRSDRRLRCSTLRVDTHWRYYESIPDKEMKVMDSQLVRFGLWNGTYSSARRFSWNHQRRNTAKHKNLVCSVILVFLGRVVFFLTYTYFLKVNFVVTTE